MTGPTSNDQLTRADRSNVAATGRGKTTSMSSVAIETPGSSSLVPAAGDMLVMLAGSQVYIVEPVEDPTDAYRVYKLSPHLAPILSAIDANVYSANAVFEPKLDLSREESRQKVADALAYEQALQSGDFDSEVELTEEEITTAAKRLRRRQTNEQQYCETWFSRCHPGSTYRELRKLVGLDMEVMGTGYVEVLRGTKGRPASLLWAPSWSIRARPVSQTIIPVRQLVRVSRLSWHWEWQLRRFRTFVQLDTTKQVIGNYKEYGDPRVLSRKTGKFYSSLQEMHANTDDEYYTDDQGTLIPAQPATELLTFKLSSSINTTYGLPGWTGVYPNLTASRDLEEENGKILTDQKVPQMFVLVAGGAGIDQESIQVLEEKLAENRQLGKKSIYFLQAKSPKMANGMLSPAPTMEIVKTKSEQHTDALGINYQKNSDKLSRKAYRMPRAELGDDDGYSKDQAMHAHRFAESQVYDPRRDIIDDRVNTTLIPDLGIQTVLQKTRPRPPKDPNERTAIVSMLTKAGVLTPDDGRLEAREILDRSFGDLLGVWSKLPKELLTAVLQTKNQLVAAALLSADEKEGFLDRLRETLSEQTGSTEPSRPGQVPIPQGGEVLSGSEETEETKSDGCPPGYHRCPDTGKCVPIGSGDGDGPRRKRDKK